MMTAWPEERVAAVPRRRLTPPHLGFSPTPSTQPSTLLQLECAARLHASLHLTGWPLRLPAPPASRDDAARR